MKSRLNKKNDTKAQITIFIILGLVIILGIIIFFMLLKAPEEKIVDENKPNAFIESCTREAVEDALAILSKQGGDIVPKGYLTHDGEDISFLCFNVEYYERCINQRPLLIEHIENEITNYIEPLVNDCFLKLEDNLEKRYDVSSSNMKLKTTLYPKNIVVDINKEFKMNRGEEELNFKNFKTILIHPIYDLAEIAMEIVNQERLYCNFDEIGYMILYPEYDVTKFIRGEGDIIYTITERATNQSLRFAVRSCSLPPGY